MARWLLGLLLVSGLVHAQSDLWQLTSQTKHVEPISLMQNVEQRFPGVIVQFDVKNKDHKLIYEIEILSPADGTVTKLHIAAIDGALVGKKTKKLAPENNNELSAVLKILQHKQTFSQVVQQAVANDKAFLVEAKLDRDLGINYLELELLNADGNQRLAFDIDQQQPLPLLTWD